MVSATAAATVAAARVDLSLTRVHSRPTIIINPLQLLLPGLICR